jgi:DNA-binding beta-propeller fold protein YncE
MIEKKTFGIIALLLLLAAGCVAPTPPYQAALEKEGELRLYLQPMPQEAHRLEFSITAISAVRHDGTAIELSPSFTGLKGKELVGVQRRLASATLPPGLYDGLSIQIGGASLLGGEGAGDLLIPDDPLWIAHEFTVGRKRASALFLSLSPKNLFTSSFRFAPDFSLASPRRQLKSLLGFATNSRTNIVSVFNKRTMEVVDTIATSSGPKGAVIDQRRGWAFIALAGDDAIEAIEVNTGEILARLQLNFGDEPIEIALSPDGEMLITANYGSNSASIIDARSLLEVGRVSLPSEPTYVVAGRSSQRAYVVQPRSNAVSVIDLPRREIAATRILDETPVRGAISRDGNSLYVITSYSSDVLVVDAVSLAETGRIYADADAASIEVDSKTGLIYVGRELGGISVVDPSSLMRIDRFRTRGNAVSLAIDDDENSLFVVLADSATVQKIDLVSKRIKGVIEVEEGSYAVVLMGER